MEFPTTNLYELESRVFTDHWSIPYKREESLGKCLIASTCLARHGKSAIALFWGPSSGCPHISSVFWGVLLFFSFWDEPVSPSSVSPPGLAEADENCKRFMDRCMPEAFKKVSNQHPEVQIVNKKIKKWSRG